MSQYIAECRVNGKEKLFLLNEAQSKNLANAMSVKTKTVEINGETIKTECVLLISPYSSWWKTDSSAQSFRGKYRCSSCFTVNDNGNRCSCATIPSPLKTDGDYADTPERLRNGWVKCLREAARVNPKFLDSKIVGAGCRKLMARYGIAHDEVFS